MSNKNLLNESQIRQFMKLAKLEPLTPGFVEGLTEATTEVDESHGRGKGENPPHARLEEADEEKELKATERELGDMDDDVHDKDEEIDDLKADLDDADAAEGRMISVDDFLGALENALEAAMGEEVEITDMGDEDEVEDDVEMDAEMDMDGDDLDVAVDMDMDSDLDERQKYGGNMGDEEESHRDYMKEEKKQGPVDKEDEHLGMKDGAERKKKQSMRDRRKEMRGARRAAGEAGDPDPMEESAEATDELVEQITKRVAARILKSALAKK